VAAMRFSHTFLDEIRARLPVSEVVGRRVKLRKAGREWKGLSPFNKEKTPSFFVNDQKQAWFDFSSNKNGNIFDFVMQTEGLSFPEAVERLAAEAGIPIPQVSPESIAREERAKTLHDVMEIASKFFEVMLSSARGAQARGYLADRGITPKTQLEFRMGYAPAERYALKEHLGSKGISVKDMIEAGLLIAGDDIPVPYDRFRDRIIIPIHDPRGRTIAFGARALNPEVQPKYLNSPDTSLFQKGMTVFNFHRARQPAHEDGSVVVVEGYMDAISIYQAGLKSVVATMGTAFTGEQIQSLWRLSPEPIVCFDADKAGISAAYRSVDRMLPLLKVGKTFRFAFMQGGKDPDELIRQRGLDAFKDVLLGSLSLWDVLWERETSGQKFDTPDARAALEHKLYSIIRSIEDKVVNTAYFRTCRIELSEFFWSVTKGRRTPMKKSALIERELKIPTEGYKHELQKVLLGMLVHYPEFLDDAGERIARLQLSPELEEFRQALYDLLIMHGEVDVELIYTQIGYKYQRYYDVLQEIHGDRTDRLKRGHKLLMRFPILDHSPSPNFVWSCIEHFIHDLEIGQMYDDLERLKDRLKAEPLDDASFEATSLRATELVREIHRNVDLYNQKGSELAEEANEIKVAGRRPPSSAVGQRLAVPEYA
jgi:DNA primase